MSDLSDEATLEALRAENGELRARLTAGEQALRAGSSREAGAVGPVAGAGTALEAARARLQCIIDGSLDMIIEADAEGRITEFNRAAQEAFGYSRQEVLGQHHSLLDAPPEAGAAGPQPFAVGGRSLQEVLSRRRDGRLFPRVLSVSLLHGARGERPGFIAISRDVTADRRGRAREQAVRQVREEVWKMETGEDVADVLVAVRAGLERLGVPFRECGANLIDLTADGLVVRRHGLGRQSRWQTQVDDAIGDEKVARLWCEGRAVYRRDLDQADPYHERQFLAQGYGAARRSVLDVPYSHGTLAVNSDLPNAFSDDDIAVLEDLAQVLTEGLRRLEDLRASEEGHRQIERNLGLELALQRVRSQILQMEVEGDWGKVVEVLDHQLRQVMSIHQSSINMVDLQSSGVRFYSVDSKGTDWELEGLDAQVFRRAMESGEAVYRARRSDPLFSPYLPAEVNSVVDVPFAGGTLGVSRTAEDAFVEADFEVLKRFAQVLSEAYRRLTDLWALRQAEERLSQAQKMESVGRLAGGVAHDFNNQLAVIIGVAQTALLQAGLPAAARRDLEEILAAAEHSAALTRQLLAFARRQPTNPQVLNLNDTVSGSLQMLRRLAGEDLELAWLPGQVPWPVKVDPGQIDQILTNLVVNARDAIAGAGRITIETGTAQLDDGYCQAHVGAVPGPHVALVVSDNGCGMDEKARAQVFEPFFTTKAVGEGTGLGLSTVYGIVRQNGGSIDVDSEPGLGTTFRIFLPRAAAAADVPAAAPEAAEPVGGTETVLIVEDEGPLLKLAARMLEAMGYTVLAAASPQEALTLAAAHAGPIDLLLTDVVLPQMNGRKLREQLALVRPGIKCLYMSGYTADVIAERGVLDEGLHFLEKPYTASSLAAKLREALAGP
jgi:PAS domain S-box-containing protein